MLERYFVRPATVDRIRSSWIAGVIEQYVDWLTERGYAARSVWQRVPVLRHFGDFARAHGAAVWAELPVHVDAFVEHWVRERGPGRKTVQARKKLAHEARNPIEQMLRLVVPGYSGRSRARWAREPFQGRAGEFFTYLRDERGLREASILHY